MSTPAWHERGRCRETDPDAFFPEKGQTSAWAKAVCARCEVRAECRAHALERDEQYGVWGGLSEDDRRQIRRDRRAAEKAA